MKIPAQEVKNRVVDILAQNHLKPHSYAKFGPHTSTSGPTSHIILLKLFLYTDLNHLPGEEKLHVIQGVYGLDNVLHGAVAPRLLEPLQEQLGGQPKEYDLVCNLSNVQVGKNCPNLVNCKIDYTYKR
jgi:hypothetical protein